MTWKLTLPCTRAEAEAIGSDIGPLALLDPPPALITTEEDEAHGRWRLDAYFESKPDKASIAALSQLVPSARAAKAKPEKLPDTDWVTLSQQGLEPVRAGRFFVHTPAHRDRIPRGMIPLEIDAGLAFGTGQHETTTGCLMMLDAMKRRGARVDNLIDLGTGTGLLAFAALKLWPRAFATATDIDPVAIDVTRENAAINQVALGTGRGRLALCVADGVHAAPVLRRARYGLVIANILAGPLIDMATDFAAIAAPGAEIILAGLLTSQADAVAMAYRRQRCRLAGRIELGDWTILRLRKRG